MKSIMIAFNQVLHREVEDLLDELGVRGFTRWVDVQGRGSVDGNPHYGDHTWPALNEVVIVVVEEAKVEAIVEGLKAIDEEFDGRGVRAFGWEAESLV